MFAIESEDPDPESLLDIKSVILELQTLKIVRISPIALAKLSLEWGAS